MTHSRLFTLAVILPIGAATVASYSQVRSLWRNRLISVCIQQVNSTEIH